MLKIGIVISSVRENRVGPQVAEYVYEKALAQHIEDVAFELVDLKDYKLPRFEEAMPPAAIKEYRLPEVKAWGKKVGELDGYIFILPEYNGSMPGSLKEAIDYIASEWRRKAASIISYGVSGGISSQITLHHVLGRLNVALPAAAGSFSLFTDFEKMAKFTPAVRHEQSIDKVILETVSWTRAMKTLR